MKNDYYITLKCGVKILNQIRTMLIMRIKLIDNTIAIVSTMEPNDFSIFFFLFCL